jgi:transcriptional regulator with XRE-family HTH domain
MYESERPTPLGREIARRIGEAGERSVRAWAIRHGINYGTLLSILDGKSRSGRADTIQQIAEALGTTAAALTGERPLVSASTPEERELVLLFRGLENDALRGAVLAAARALSATSESAEHQKASPVGRRKVASPGE